jgi:hypothetical protein
VSENRIKTLRYEDPDAWMGEFFPEYIPITAYFEGANIPVPIEVTPWEGWDNGMGIQPNATRIGTEEREIVNKQTGETRVATRTTYLDVSEEEYREWAERINYFRNGGLTPLGGEGLNPNIFRGARNSVSHPRKRLECLSGTYYFPQPPNRSNDRFGVNSYFKRKGRSKYSYVSDKYGPGNWVRGIYGVGTGLEFGDEHLLPDIDTFNQQWWIRTLMS